MSHTTCTRRAPVDYCVDDWQLVVRVTMRQHPRSHALRTLLAAWPKNSTRPTKFVRWVTQLPN